MNQYTVKDAVISKLDDLSSELSQEQYLECLNDLIDDLEGRKECVEQEIEDSNKQ